MQTVIGQTLDLTNSVPPSSHLTNNPFDFTNYTEIVYNSIVKWKTAYYSFYLPVASALYLVNTYDS